MSEQKITFCPDGPTVCEPKSVSLYFEDREVVKVEVPPGSSAKQIAELIVVRVGEKVEAPSTGTGTVTLSSRWPNYP